MTMGDNAACGARRSESMKRSTGSKEEVSSCKRLKTCDVIDLTVDDDTPPSRNRRYASLSLADKVDEDEEEEVIWVPNHSEKDETKSLETQNLSDCAHKLKSNRKMEDGGIKEEPVKTNLQNQPAPLTTKDNQRDGQRKKKRKRSWSLPPADSVRELDHRSQRRSISGSTYPATPRFEDAIPEKLSTLSKERNFQEARRPVFRLEREIDSLKYQLTKITPRTEEYRICLDQITRVKQDLQKAGEDAANSVYYSNNSAGNMGLDDGQTLSIDFHGLYIKEAIQRYQEMVLPILPVQKSINLIVGKGWHSKGKRGVLATGLVEHICRSVEFTGKKVDYCINPHNHGVVHLQWIG